MAKNFLPKLHSIASVYLCGHNFRTRLLLWVFTDSCVYVSVFKTFDILRNVCNMKSQLVSVERKLILFKALCHCLQGGSHCRMSQKFAKVAFSCLLHIVKYILSVSDGALSPVSSLNGGGRPIPSSIYFLTNS